MGSIANILKKKVLLQISWRKGFEDSRGQVTLKVSIKMTLTLAFFMEKYRLPLLIDLFKNIFL